MDDYKLDNEGKKLWQTFKKGDRQAFEILLQQHYPRLLSYGVRLMLDKTLVEDTLQEFFIDLWNKRAGLSDPQNLHAYLLSSFRRRLFREKDKKDKTPLKYTLADDYDFEVQFDIETHLIEKEVESNTAEKLQYHLDSLTKRQKEAIYLRFYQEMDYPEIAHIMSINHHSAINLVYDALKLLRKNWFVPLFFMLPKFF